MSFCFFKYFLPEFLWNKYPEASQTPRQAPDAVHEIQSKGKYAEHTAEKRVFKTSQLRVPRTFDVTKEGEVQTLAGCEDLFLN